MYVLLGQPYKLLYERRHTFFFFFVDDSVYLYMAFDIGFGVFCGADANFAPLGD